MVTSAKKRDTQRHKGIKEGTFSQSPKGEGRRDAKSFEHSRAYLLRGFTLFL